MIILGIETSADETSVAVVEDGRKVLSCAVASSMDIHVKTGGIIPENAARKQLEYMLPTLEEALNTAFPNASSKDPFTLFENIDAIAVTIGHGLIGSLLVGVETAKTLAALFNKPLIPVDHVKAHPYGAFLGEDPMPVFPLLALTVSGGHTGFTIMRDHGDITWVAGTRDDAAGECFDKCARLLGLPYPGGPSIGKAAQVFISANPHAKLNLLPRPMMHDVSNDMSFSGLKTAVSKVVKENTDKHFSLEQLAAEVQEAILDTLIHKTIKILRAFELNSVVVCGGVSANDRLKSQLVARVQSELPHTSIHIPQITFSTDNAAMVASFAFFNYKEESFETVAPNPELHF